MPSFPLKIVLYKYLQGNDINEGRELFAVSKDGRIPSSVLKLWKEIFRLDHAWQEGKGRWRQPGRISLIRKNRQGRSRGGSRCLRGVDLDAATHKALPKAQPHPAGVFSNPFERSSGQASTSRARATGQLQQPAQPRCRWGRAPRLLLRGRLGVPGTSSALLPAPLPMARALPDDQSLFSKRPNLHLLFSSSQIAQRTSSIPCPASMRVCFSCNRAGGIRPCQGLGVGIN